MTELEAHTRAEEIVRHHFDDPLQLRSFVAHCLLAESRLALAERVVEKAHKLRMSFALEHRFDRDEYLYLWDALTEYRKEKP